MPETVAKQVEADNKGGTASGDGSQDGFQIRLNEQIEKTRALELKLAEAEGKIETLTKTNTAPKTEQKTEQPPQFTRAQLRDAVEAGKITQSESDAIWDDQQAKHHDASLKEVKAEVKKEITETAKIGGQIDRYKEMVPDLNKRTSEAFKKVEAKYVKYTKELGMPENERTELAALDAVYGSVDELKARAASKDNRPETHREGANRGGGDGGDTPDKDGAPRDLSPKLKNHYQRMINQRMYKGWDDPTLKTELTHIRSGRQKAA